MDKLRKHIAARISETEQHARETPEHYRGHDWFQLSDAQAEVFGIDSARWPRMLVAWQLYEACLDIVLPRDHELDEALIEEERARRPELYAGRLMAYDNFRTLAMDTADLTEAEVCAVYVKQEFWRKRDIALEDAGLLD
jgi:hypothetical protein